MTCKICDLIKNNKILYEASQYVIIKHNNEIYGINKRHDIKFKQCSACQKQYIRRAIENMFIKEFDHNSFILIQDRNIEHYYIYTKTQEIDDIEKKMFKFS